MTYSVQPSYQEQMGFGFGGEGEFGGLGSKPAVKDTTSNTEADNTNNNNDDNQDDTPVSIKDKVSSFLSNVTSKATNFSAEEFVFGKKNAAAFAKERINKAPKTTTRLLLEQTPASGYMADQDSSTFYDQLIKEKEQSLGSYMNYEEKDLDDLSTLYQSRNNALLNERIYRALNPVVKKEIAKNPSKIDGLSNEDFQATLLSEDGQILGIEKMKEILTNSFFKPIKRPLALSAKDNLLGLY
tara:strand:- start:28 stop:750 length:723 start_codon:yes stop_codon:yes gene_type:complete